MLDEKITKLIDTKASEMNSEAPFCYASVSKIIEQLNCFIDGKVDLTEEEIDYSLDFLIGYYTITLDFPLDAGLKILRAVRFTNPTKKPCFSEVSRLSYIPKSSSIIPSRGRMNKRGDSLFYGCIYFNDFSGGFNVGFSEINALKNDKVNILKSKTISEIKVNYVGIYDLIKREEKPYFLMEEAYTYLKEVYEYQERKFDKHVFLAFQLCDKFFNDILRRRKSGNLYIVTSILASHFLDRDEVDGLIYTSVKVDGSPVIAIKPSSIDRKLLHKEATSYEIQECYGQEIFKAKPLYKGAVNGETIDWN